METIATAVTTTAVTGPGNSSCGGCGGICIACMGATKEEVGLSADVCVQDPLDGVGCRVGRRRGHGRHSTPLHRGNGAHGLRASRLCNRRPPRLQLCRMRAARRPEMGGGSQL